MSYAVCVESKEQAGIAPDTPVRHPIVKEGSAVMRRKRETFSPYRR